MGINSSYHWQPIDGTNFALGLVIAVNDHVMKLAKLTPREGKPISAINSDEK